MERTQWVITMHFNRGITQTFKFDSKSDALEAIRVGVFVNEDCINFSCFREEVKKSSLEQKLDDIQKMMELKDRILAKM